MKTVTIRELHAKTGELVRDAERHGQIFVTDRGRRIARILPDQETGRIPYFARRQTTEGFRRLERSGKTGGGTDVTEGISADRDHRA